MLTVVERCHDDEPITCRDVGCKGAVFVRADVEPNIVGFVVEQEVVGNAIIRGVHQGSVDEVGVLQRHLNRIINRLQTDSDGVKELLANKVVIRGVVIISRGSVEHDVVAAGRKANGDDSRFAVVF